MNTIITVIVAILAMVIGCVAALYFSQKNAKSRANEIMEKARLEAEVLKNNEVMKGKEAGMTIKSEAEKEANNMLLWFFRIIGIVMVIGGLKGIFGFIEAAATSWTT